MLIVAAVLVPAGRGTLLPPPLVQGGAGAGDVALAQALEPPGPPDPGKAATSPTRRTSAVSERPAKVHTKNIRFHLAAFSVPFYLALCVQCIRCRQWADWRAFYVG